MIGFISDKEKYEQMGYLAYQTTTTKTAKEVADSLDLSGEDREAFIEGFNNAAWDD